MSSSPHNDPELVMSSSPRSAPEPAESSSPGNDPELSAATAIRDAANQYLRTRRAEAQRDLPPEWAERLPHDAGEPMRVTEVNAIQLAPWWLKLSEREATLQYTPPEGVGERMRFFFTLALVREGNAWRVPEHAVHLGHAWRRER